MDFACAWGGGGGVKVVTFALACEQQEEALSHFQGCKIFHVSRGNYLLTCVIATLVFGSFSLHKLTQVTKHNFPLTTQISISKSKKNNKIKNLP